jgi:chromosomal replication initiation ATPase DnaA
MPDAPKQLALDLPLTPRYGREDFLVSPSNERAYALIERWPDWPDQILLLTGPQGSGKSHLAAIWAERAGARITDAAALTQTEVPRALVTGALVIEDLAPERADEQAFFHLFNLAREEDAYVLVTAAQRSDLDGFRLPDLASRLRALPVIALTPPGDALLAAVLVKLFADRQLAVDEETVTFLLSRMERSLAAARDMVGRLDRAALSRGRRITRALASELLREQEPQA